MFEITGKRITVMGLGTRGGGLGVAAYLASHGAVVTVTDNRPAEQLTDPMAALAELPVRYALGGHQERDFTREGADIVVRNPAVPKHSPWLELARRSGVLVEMEMSIFLRLSPAPVIGITGTKGKSSTSALAGEMLRSWRADAVVAGNMGVSAVAHLDALTPSTPVLLELSSWQLEGLEEHGLAPHIGVLTNISQDHLDAYETYEAYADCKRSIARHMGHDDIFVVNADDPGAMKAVDSTSAQVVRFSGSERDADVRIEGGSVRWDVLGRRGEAALPDRPHFRGVPLQANVAAATAAAITLGVRDEDVARGLEAFTGIANRSEFVASPGGVDCINDTAATAPAAVAAALGALGGRRVHVLAGGSDKRSDLTPLADALAGAAATVTLLDGTATPKLEGLLRERAVAITGTVGSMREGVEAAYAAAALGEVVLLSPGCASFGMFRDEFDRGEQFRQAVREIADRERGGSA